MGKNKTELLSNEVRHIDIKKFDFTSLIDQMQDTAFQAKNSARAAQIYDHMLTDKNCSVISCLAGSLISAGLKTGANIVDQDFFEGQGFKHYQGYQYLDDMHLRICDDTICQIANNMKPDAYSSREFIAGYAYSKGNWRTREARAYSNFFNQAQAELASA